MMVMIMNWIAIKIEIKISSYGGFGRCWWIRFVIKFVRRRRRCRLLRIISNIRMWMIIECWIIFRRGWRSRMRCTRKPTIGLTWITARWMRIGTHGISRLKSMIIHRWIVLNMRWKRMQTLLFFHPIELSRDWRCSPDSKRLIKCQVQIYVYVCEKKNN